VLLLALITIPGTAYGLTLAYIDPLTGSVFIQMVIAGVLGALFVAKSSVARVRTFVRGLWAKILRP
jgi:hypothetical protein